MAKRVIQLYDKYKSTTKVYPLIVGESITPDAKEKIDDIIEDNVVANPTPAGGETTLAYLEIGGTKYALPVPTNVVANPTLAGTEAELGSIQIGETKYKIGGGKQLYMHCITARYAYSETREGIFTFKIINDSNTSLSLTDCMNYIKEKGFVFAGNPPHATPNYYEASGSFVYLNVVYNIIGLFVFDNILMACYKNGNTYERENITGNSTIVDTVVAI